MSVNSICITTKPPQYNYNRRKENNTKDTELHISFRNAQHAVTQDFTQIDDNMSIDDHDIITTNILVAQDPHTGDTLTTSHTTPDEYINNRKLQKKFPFLHSDIAPVFFNTYRNNDISDDSSNCSESTQHEFLRGSHTIDQERSSDTSSEKLHSPLNSDSEASIVSNNP
jgi:hypothetical protein